MPLPALPAFFDMVYTKPETGKLAHDGYMYNDQTFQTLNAIVILINSFVNSVINQGTPVNVKNNGIAPPTYTTAEIVALEPNVTNGTMWYNSTLKKLQFKADTGVIETITST